MGIALSRYAPGKSYKGQKTFDCGHDAINGFVRRSLHQQARRDLSVAYVLTEEDDTFVGFCTLMAASIRKEDFAVTAPPSLPLQVPVTKLSMLGVASAYKGQGLGSALLRHALKITAEASEAVGTYGLYLDADDGAWDFYSRHSFVPLQPRQAPNPTPMFLHVATIRQAMAAAKP